MTMAMLDCLLYYSESWTLELEVAAQVMNCQSG